MSEKKVTVKELAYQLKCLIENGYGDKTIELSVNYDNCDHIQDLSKVYWNKDFNWITLAGGKE